MEILYVGLRSGSEAGLSLLGKFEDAGPCAGLGRQGAKPWKRPSEARRSGSEERFWEIS
jgi:hypothetical protein